MSSAVNESLFISKNKLKINAVPMDNGACGRLRVLYPAMSLFNSYKVTISPAGTYNFFGQDWIWTQRLAGDAMRELIERKKQLGIKFIVDYDDCVWKELPSYNYCNVHVKENYESMKKYLNDLADIVTCSTSYIADSLKEFVDESKIRIIPNSLDYNRWRFDRYPAPKQLSFFYAGSPTHYSANDTGDFSKGLVQYLQGKRIEVQGICPPFLKAQRIYNWVDIDDYPIYFASNALQSKFILAPLQDNFFNHCKSDLKYLESAAVGRVCLVSDLDTYACSHPYQRLPLNATSSTYKFIVERAIEHYDEIIQHQYDVLNSRWMNKNTYAKLFE